MSLFGLRSRVALTLSASTLYLLTAGPAFAQTALQPEAPPTSDDQVDKEIIVTGSRISRPDIDSPNPVEVLTAKDIQNSGETNLTEFLKDSPALVGSLSDERNSGSNTAFQTVGLNLLDLRNLGTQRTLVLINGRRHVNAYPGENSVDVNTIPIDLVDRVDVLTGGASAIYGADAVSGVVNFILKRNFEGLSARFQTGISEKGDAGRQFGSIVAGTNFAGGRGNIAVAYEYNNQDRLSQRARAFTGDPASRFELLRDPTEIGNLTPNGIPDRKLFNNISWADSAPNGAVDITLDLIPDFDGNGRVYDRGTLLPGSGGRATNSSSNTPTAGYFGDFSPALERHNVNLLGSFEFSKALRFFVEAKYVKTRSFTEIQPSFDFFTYLTPDNYYLQQRFGNNAPDGALVSRDNFDFGTARQKADRDTYRGVVGIDGTLTEGDRSGNIRYELSYVYGRANSVVTDENQRVTDRYFAAIDAVAGPGGQPTCRINLPGETIIDQNNYAGIAQVKGATVTGAPLSFTKGQCLPLTILGSGLSSQAAIDWVYVDSVTRAYSEQHVVSGSVSGDLGFLFRLPGGPVGFAVGGEYRKESTFSTPSAFQQAGYFDGGSAILPSGGGYNVKEAFAEINVPLLRDRPFFKDLSFGAAVRYSDYSTIGTTLTYKFDGTYSPIRDITFRGTYSQAVRAPNITELFSPLQGTFQFLTDPCDKNTPASEGTSFRAANCRAALTAAGLSNADILAFNPAGDPKQSTSQPGLTGGNPNLTEETAKTWTAGLVLRPSFLRGFSLTADWYDIKLTNAISTPDVNDVFRLCVDAPTLNNAFCNSFTRAAGTGFINSFTVQSQNVAAYKTSGLEVAIAYVVKPSPSLGTFDFRLSGGYLNDLTLVSIVGGVPEQDANVGNGAPRYIGNLDLGWQKGPFAFNYGLAWQDRTQRFSNLQLQNPDFAPENLKYYKARWEHDVRFSVDVTKKFNFYGGVNNVFNQQPDIAANAGIPVSAVGRFFYFGAKVKLPKF